MGVSAIPPERPLIIWHPLDTPPDGYMKANAPTVSRTAYAWLFSKIGTMYGAGDGETTFVAGPDMRGEFQRGWDDGRGVDPGRLIGSAQGFAIQAHTHTEYAPTGSGNGYTNTTNSGSTTQSRNTGSTGGTETRPRNVAGLFCIAIAP